MKGSVHTVSTAASFIKRKRQKQDKYAQSHTDMPGWYAALKSNFPQGTLKPRSSERTQVSTMLCDTICTGNPVLSTQDRKEVRRAEGFRSVNFQFCKM